MKVPASSHIDVAMPYKLCLTSINRMDIPMLQVLLSVGESLIRAKLRVFDGITLLEIG